MNPAERGLRLRLVTAVRRLADRGLNQGSSGNASVRFGTGFIVTPCGQGLRLDGSATISCSSTCRARPRAVTRPHPNGGCIATSSRATRRPAPSSTRIRLSPRPLRACGRRFPPFHYEVAFAGGRRHSLRSPTRLSVRRNFPTMHLPALDGRRACLLANHGAVAWSDDRSNAPRCWRKRSKPSRASTGRRCRLGEPPLLDADEMKRVLQKFESYGR